VCEREGGGQGVRRIDEREISNAPIVIADVWGFKMKHALAILYASRAECGTIPTYPPTDPVG
jgi:hypothetical protein